MLKELMIHKTVLRLSAFISRNASCWHCCTVITPASQRRRAGDVGAIVGSAKDLHTFTHWAALGLGEPGQQSWWGGDKFGALFFFIMHYRAKNRGSSLCLDLYSMKPAWRRCLNVPQNSKGQAQALQDAASWCVELIKHSWCHRHWLPSPGTPLVVVGMTEKVSSRDICCALCFKWACHSGVGMLGTSQWGQGEEI